MIQGKSFLAIIPARGGSKSVPRKNIHLLGGKPLLAWTIEAAKRSKYLDRVILSSDDEAIIDVAKLYGCEVPFIRPVELSGDTAATADVVLHAMDALSGYDYVVVLQPTSPFRIAEDIDGCVEQCVKRSAGACVSVAETTESPYWMYTLQSEVLQPVVEFKKEFYQRQNLPMAYMLNGAVYTAETAWFKKHQMFLTEETIGYVMPSQRSLDIDTAEDFRYAEFLLAELKS